MFRCYVQKSCECCHDNHITKALDIHKMLVFPLKQSSKTTKFSYFEEMISDTHERNIMQLLYMYLSYDILLPHHFLYNTTD